MKFKKIYTLGLGLLIAGMSAVNAQTQDNEKFFTGWIGSKPTIPGQSL